jgi:hypothetical protein
MKIVDYMHPNWVAKAVKERKTFEYYFNKWAKYSTSNRKIKKYYHRWVNSYKWLDANGYMAYRQGTTSMTSWSDFVRRQREEYLWKK